MMIKLANPLQHIDRPSTDFERKQWATDLAVEILLLTARKLKKNGKPRPITRGDYDRVRLPKHQPVTIQRLFELEALRDKVIGELNAQQNAN